MNITESIEIGKSSEVLKKALDLVRQEYCLITESPEAMKHLEFNASLGWKTSVWNSLNEEYVIVNPMSKDTYFLKAFDFFKIQPGSDFSTGGSSIVTGSTVLSETSMQSKDGETADEHKDS